MLPWLLLVHEALWAAHRHSARYTTGRLPAANPLSCQPLISHSQGLGRPGRLPACVLTLLWYTAPGYTLMRPRWACLGALWSGSLGGMLVAAWVAALGTTRYLVPQTALLLCHCCFYTSHLTCCPCCCHDCAAAAAACCWRATHLTCCCAVLCCSAAALQTAALIKHDLWHPERWSPNHVALSQLAGERGSRA